MQKSSTHHDDLNEKEILLIDFDSTFVQAETFEVLADLLPNKEEILSKIAQLTAQAMNGGLSFKDALHQRLDLMSINRGHIESAIAVMRKKISPSILGHRDFMEKNADHMYILSGGFREVIIPIVEEFGIHPTQVHANSLLFDFEGKVVGVDESNLLSHDLGKVKVAKRLVEELKERGCSIKRLIVVGDGYTDLEIKVEGSKTILPSRGLNETSFIEFIAFTETAKRPEVVAGADCVAANFGEVIARLPACFKRGEALVKRQVIQVLLLENISENAVLRFTEMGKSNNRQYEFTCLKQALSETELIKALKGVQILGTRSKTQVSQSVLAHPNASSLMAIGAFCIGTNQIDKDTARLRGVAVFNAPFSNTRSVVELAIAELILLSRGVYQKSNLLHRGIWQKSAEGAHEIRGKTLGIIGYGNIGSQLSVLAEGLGLKVLYYDKIEKLPLGNAKVCKTLTQLLNESDIVSLHVDGHVNNTHLIDESAIQQMRDGAILLNLSRGHVVDLVALEGAIKSKKIKGCALDVFPEEPESNQTPFTHPICQYDEVILTPHIGGSTEEAQVHIGDFVATRLADYAQNGTTQLSLNFPNISLPTLFNLHRLIHIHQNRPGILAKINSVLADASINIEGQYLKTNEDIGYVITDISATYSDGDGLMSKLVAIKHTIKVRLLY